MYLVYRIFLVLFLILCFLRMFARHKLRRRRLAAMTLDQATPDQAVAFDHWKRNLRSNSLCADAAVWCFILMWLVPLGFLGLLVLPFVANHHRREAQRIKSGSGLPLPSIKQLEAKEG